MNLRSAIETEIRWLEDQAEAEDEFTPPANASAAYRIAAQHLQSILADERPEDWS